MPSSVLTRRRGKTMAATSNTLAAFSICKCISPSSARSRLPVHFLRLHNATRIPTSLASVKIFRRLSRTRKLRCSLAPAEEEETLASEGDEASTTSPPAATDQTVSVAVSPSDMITMFFQAEGTMNETAIPTVTKALEETEGIADLRVQVLEGIASVELTKQTTVQATGVASNLVEIIQSKGFKLQTLNLSFQDEEDLS